MKSRNLHTTHDLIASNYTKTSIGDGRFLHKFTPSTTNTVYQFIANNSDEIEEGEAYNVGFYIDEEGNNIIDTSCLSKNTTVNKTISYLYAQTLSTGKHAVNKNKNDTRVKHSGEGYYWGKKYAWREFGLVIPKNAFHAYMKEIAHPTVECDTEEIGKSFTNQGKSFAYKEDGIKEAMDALIDSAVKPGRVRYKSPLFKSQFTIRGIEAITDKK